MGFSLQCGNGLIPRIHRGRAGWRGSPARQKSHDSCRRQDRGDRGAAACPHCRAPWRCSWVRGSVQLRRSGGFRRSRWCCPSTPGSCAPNSPTDSSNEGLGEFYNFFCSQTKGWHDGVSPKFLGSCILVRNVPCTTRPSEEAFSMDEVSLTDVSRTQPSTKVQQLSGLRA
jgi:hypothetical protein